LVIVHFPLHATAGGANIPALRATEVGSMYSRPTVVRSMRAVASCVAITSAISRSSARCLLESGPDIRTVQEIARSFGRQGDDNLHARAQIVAAAARSVRSIAWRATTATITNDEPDGPIARRLSRVLSGKIGVPPRHDRQQREKEHSNADSRTCCDQ